MVSLNFIIQGGPWESNTSLVYNYRLKHFSADGSFINQFVTQASQGIYDLSIDINDIDIATDGSVWVADKASFKHFKADGTLIEKINSYGLGTGSAYANHLALAVDGSLWTISYSGNAGDSFVRHSNPDASIVSQFRNKGLCTTEYDDIQNTLYLWGVAASKPLPFQLGASGGNYPAGTQFYDAVLQFQNGRYNLLSVTPSDQICSSQYLYFDSSSNVLNIPSVQVINTLYFGTLINTGNYSFSIQAATPFNNQ